jgi:hypothetical protein
MNVSGTSMNGSLHNITQVIIPKTRYTGEETSATRTHGAAINYHSTATSGFMNQRNAKRSVQHQPVFNGVEGRMQRKNNEYIKT